MIIQRLTPVAFFRFRRGLFSCYLTRAAVLQWQQKRVGPGQGRIHLDGLQKAYHYHLPAMKA